MFRLLFYTILFLACSVQRSAFLMTSWLTAASRQLFIPERDSSFREIVGRHLHPYPVAGKNADVVHAHLARDMSGNFVSVLQFHTEHRIRQCFDDGSVLFYCCLFSHSINAL